MRKNDKGQMLLIVVLTMIVALTVGLSVVSRTITNLRISKQNEESQRAFQAAEAGIERTIQSASGSSTLQFTENGASYKTDVSTLGGGSGPSSFLLNGGDLVDQDAGQQIDLGNISGNLTIFWGTSSQNSCSGASARPAIEVVLLSGNSSSPTLSKSVYDDTPNCPGRIPGASPAGSGGTIEDTAFNYGVVIPVNQGLIMRVIPIFNSGKIGISSNVTLPSQGKVVESTGQSGQTVRKVRYFSSNPQIPLELFPYSLISQ